MVLQLGDTIIFCIAYHYTLPSSSVITVATEVNGPTPTLVLAATAHVYVVNGDRPVMVMSVVLILYCCVDPVSNAVIVIL